MSKLLLDDKPLIILPSLAAKIGLNESIVLQQLHYWLLESKHIKDGEKWIYNTYKEWQKQFPFWSEKTIRRTITKLENDGLIISSNYNKMKIDNTKWYRINYELLVSSPCGQNDQTEWTSCPDGCGQNDQANNQRLPKTTTEIYSEIISYLNDKTNSSYKASSKTTIRLINARLNEGFTLDEFKRVIDKKTEEWLHDKGMCKYLRPETLFGTKFEGYLNQKEMKQPVKQKYEEYQEERKVVSSVNGSLF